jgi:pimeloyl-ACP methyl ester carboxylesterase
MAKQTYHSINVDGLDVFYRQAGDAADPTLLLLHGFPTSSHMFRDLIPLLSDRFHLVAPDLPGFGHTTLPSRDKFAYTFENLAKVETVVQLNNIGPWVITYIDPKDDPRQKPK